VELVNDQPGHRAEIRDFLATRRAKLAPSQVGLPAGSRRRVPGLRREEVAVLAGVSTEWYSRLEKGHISGVSDEVLEAVAQALQLTEEERVYLHDLARAARSVHRTPGRRREPELDPSWQWMLDSMAMAAAFVRNGRLDMVASNALARALHAPMFDSPTVDKHGRPNFARYFFLDPGSKHFFADWTGGADATTALLRAESGRYPNDRALRELVGELSTLSPEFRTRWAAHDIRTRHDGVKLLQHPDVGQLELTYRSLDLPGSDRKAHDLTIYAAEPGSPSEDRLKLLASWAATPSTPPTPTTRPS
jgi:transcriptional regulator with XRE-family HTH domain